MILIGSRAFLLRAPGILNRRPCDFDWICTREEYHQWMEKNADKLHITKTYELPEFNKMIVEGDVNLEFEIITPGTSSELLVDLITNEWIETPFGLIPPIDLLFVIKDSHKFKKFHLNANGFWKTAIDWHTMKNMGAKIRPEYQAFHKLRETESYSAQKHPKLNVSKDAFFKDDGLEDVYVFQHDDIHESVKLHDHPAYTYYLKDGEEVLCDKKKFFSVSEDIRLAGGCEEGLTLALERSLIPNKGVWTPDFAFRFALAKTASSITSGWFRAYCHLNLFQIISLYNQTSTRYHEKFLEDVKAGRVRYMDSKTTSTLLEASTK